MELNHAFLGHLERIDVPPDDRPGEQSTLDCLAGGALQMNMFGSKSSPRTLRGTLCWLIASLVTPIAFGAITVLVLESKRSSDVQHERLKSLATTLLQGVDAELARARTQLEVLAASPQFTSGDLPSLYVFAKAVADKVPRTVIALVDADGQVLFSTAERWGEPLPNMWRIAHERRWAEWNGSALPVGADDLSRRAMEENKTMFSDLFYSIYQRPALAIALPVKAHGGARQAFVMVFPPDLIQSAVANSITARDLRVVVTDHNRVVVAHNAAAVLSVGNPDKRLPVGSHSGSYSFLGPNYEPLEGVFAVSPINGFVVRVAHAASPPLYQPATLALIGLLGLASAVAIGLVVLFANRLTRPIIQLAADLADGRMPSRELRSEIVEHQLLSDAVAAALDADRLRRADASRKLAEMKDRVLFAEQMIGIVSHDLRTPLLAARMSASALKVVNISPEGRPLLDQVQSSVRHAETLVHELLDFTRARIGDGLPVDLEPVHLHALIARHLSTLRQCFPLHDLVHESLGEGPCEADPARLIQVVDNLVNNAVTFGAPQKPILITTTIAREEFSIAVSNAGSPIPQELMPQIFEPMVRSTKTSVKRAEGVGLGLFIVREIARAHCGEANVISTLEEGTTVTVSFPR
jgi:signal transduction histidine kinase